jgi:hypothetical protein
MMVANNTMVNPKLLKVKGVEEVGAASAVEPMDPSTGVDS